MAKEKAEKKTEPKKGCEHDMQFCMQHDDPVLGKRYTWNRCSKCQETDMKESDLADATKSEPEPEKEPETTGE